MYLGAHYYCDLKDERGFLNNAGEWTKEKRNRREMTEKKKPKEVKNPAITCGPSNRTHPKPVCTCLLLKRETERGRGGGGECVCVCERERGG